MFQRCGYLSDEELSSVFPDMDRLQSGPVAIIECIQEIPCNPCQDACPRDAIGPFIRMTDNPVINFEKCNGCGLCIGSCPGLAIFVLHLCYGQDTSMIKIPYEMLPVPCPEQSVSLLDRSGQVIGRGIVKKIQSLKHNPKTHIIWIEIPRELYKKARNIKVDNNE